MFFFLLMRGFVLRDEIGEESSLGWIAFMEHYKHSLDQPLYSAYTSFFSNTSPTYSLSAA